MQVEAAVLLFPSMGRVPWLVLQVWRSKTGPYAGMAGAAQALGSQNQLRTTSLS